MMEKGNYLLKRYLADRTEEHFRAIVREHSAMVRATASRRLNGDLDAAQDVSQQVFIRLAQSAQKLSGEINLAGWLYRQSCRISADFIRTEHRRSKRESTAAELMKKEEGAHPQVLLEEIDHALGNLNAPDREAIVLRYLEDRSHQAVGKHLGVSEEAARKRCTRAVETLRSWFSKQGIGVTTPIIIATLSGLATPPLPAATVNSLSQGALQQATPALTLWSGVLSFMGGVALVSLTASGFHYGQSQTTRNAGSPESSQATLPVRRTDTRSQKQELSVESLIEQIKALYLQPRNTLVRMQIRGLFESLPAKDRRSFFRQADELLSSGEKDFAYHQFVDLMMEENPEASFDLILEERIMERLEYRDLGSYERHFRMWVKASPEAAEAWLIQNWSHPDLKTSAFESTLGSYLSHKFIRRSLHKNGVSAAFKKAASFGGPDDYENNLKAITGTTWHSVENKFAVEIFAAIRDLPDKVFRERLTKEFLSNWLDRKGPHLLSSLEKMDLDDRVEAALTTLDYQAPKIKEVRYANGSMRTSYDRPTLSKSERALFLQEREEALRATALEVGFNEQDINLRILDHYIQKKDERALDILDLLEPGEDSDAVILEGLNHYCLNTNRGSAQPEIIAFNGALVLSNPDRRIGAAKAIFRRIIIKDEATAREMIQYPDFPAEITAALREVATQNGL